MCDTLEKFLELINADYDWQQNCEIICSSWGLFQERLEMEVAGLDAILSYLPKEKNCIP